MTGEMEANSRVMETRRRFREVYGLPDERHDYGSMENFANAQREYIRKVKALQRQQEMLEEQRRHHEAWQLAQFIQSLITPLVTPQPATPPTQPAQPPQNVEVIQFEAAPFLRRLLAEFIDFLVFLSLKIFVIGALIEIDIIDLRSLSQALDDDQDIMQFITLAQELLPLEVVCKVFCCILEGIMMSCGMGPIGIGQTPGKWILGIRVISCREVRSGDSPDFIAVTAPNMLTWQQSLKRSFMKNVVVNSLFPLSTAAFQINNGRVFYDLVVKTVVIMEVN